MTRLGWIVLGGLLCTLACGGSPGEPAATGSHPPPGPPAEATASLTLAVAPPGIAIVGVQDESGHSLATCSATCTITATPGTRVHLVNLSVDSIISDGFSGDCSGSSCVLALNDKRSVTAAFHARRVFNAAVTVVGGGQVTQDFVNCFSSCNYSVVETSAASLVATPLPGSVFAGWTGACAGTGACTFTPTGDVSITATFTRKAVPHFRAMEVSHLGGLTNTSPVVLDEAGWLAGTVFTNGALNVFFIDINVPVGEGAMHLFPLPCCYPNVTVSGTSAGNVTGTLWDAGEEGPPIDDPVAFLASGTTLLKLGTLGGRWSNGAAVNASGTVVGSSETAAGAVHAFSWAAGVMTDLGTLPGDSHSAAISIDAAGVVTGLSCNTTTCSVAVFDRGQVRDAGPAPVQDNQVFGAGTGKLGIDLSGTRALWLAGATIDLLPALNAGSFPTLAAQPAGNPLLTHAVAANSRLDVVGDVQNEVGFGNESVAVLLHDGALYALSLTGWPFPARQSLAINEGGRILVSTARAGTTIDPTETRWVLVPTP